MVAGLTRYIALQKGYSELKNYHDSYNCILYLKVWVNIKYKRSSFNTSAVTVNLAKHNKSSIKKVVSFLCYYFLQLASSKMCTYMYWCNKSTKLLFSRIAEHT